MGKLFGKVMASLLSGAMLFGGTSFADGGGSKFCLVEDEDMRDGEKVKECAICLSSVECERDGETVKITKRVTMEEALERIIKITKHMVGGKKVNKVIEGKDEEVCNVKMDCCGNYFCRGCILRWINCCKYNSSCCCPLCKSKLNVGGAKSLLTSYERLQCGLIDCCEKNSDVVLDAAIIGAYFASLLGVNICLLLRNQKLRNQKKS